MLENLAEKQRDIKTLEMEVTAYEDMETVVMYLQKSKELRDATTALNNALNAIPMDEIIEWRPTKKDQVEIYWEGTSGIQKTTKVTRKIIPSRVITNHPFIAEKFAHYTLSDIEPQITGEELEALIVREPSVSYKAMTRQVVDTPTVKTATKPKTSKKRVMVVQ
jgi:hypothetical protein